MTEQIRKEFEAWWRHEHENTLYCESAWRGWKASRAALAPAAKPRLTGANGGEFKFVLKWDGVDSHPDLEIINGVFDMAGKNHISDLLIAISDWISEYAESLRTQPTRRTKKND